MMAMAWTPVLPDANPVGPLSARCCRSWSILYGSNAPLCGVDPYAYLRQDGLDELLP
jgi:hypothetical protein